MFSMLQFLLLLGLALPCYAEAFDHDAEELEACPVQNASVSDEDSVLLQTGRRPPCPQQRKRKRYTLGVSIYGVQPGFQTLLHSVQPGFPVNRFGHTGVFWLPFEINPYTQLSTWGRLVKDGKTCKRQGKKFDKIKTAQECAQAVSREPGCSPMYMWSPKYSPANGKWKCRCCKYEDHETYGDSNKNWQVWQSYSNWLCYHGDDNWNKPELPDGSPMKMPKHDNGKCGSPPETVTPDEIHAYGNDKWGVEMTYSSGHGGDYDQTWASGPPGRYIHFSGSDALWHGQATWMYYITTDLTFEEFYQAARSITVKMNDEAGYDAARNNCQNFATRMLNAVGATELSDKLRAHTFVQSSTLVGEAAVFCDIGAMTNMCWPIQGHGPSRRRRRHVGMADNCHAAYGIQDAQPHFYGTAYTCKKH